MQADLKRKTINRLHRAVGHLKAVEKLVEEDKYCIDIIQQSLAVQKALAAVDLLILDSHLHTCVEGAICGDEKTREKALKEILTVFQKGR